MHEALYQQHILDHASRPHNKGVLAGATVVAEGSNPSCGDMLTLYLAIEDATIRAVSWIGTGCAISQAAGSLLSDKLVGLSLGAARGLSEADMYAMLGIVITPARQKCALLAYRALSNALARIPGE